MTVVVLAAGVLIGWCARTAHMAFGERISSLRKAARFRNQAIVNGLRVAALTVLLAAIWLTAASR